MEKNDDFFNKIKTVFSTNVFVILFGAINGIILPKYLSIDSYAQVKTFQLYYTYVGLLHLGMADALQIKYGGAYFKEIDREKLSIEIAAIRTILILEEVFFLSLSLLFDNYILMAISLTVLFTNMISCYKILFQATGVVEKYSLITFFGSSIKFIANLGVVALKLYDSCKILIFIYVLADIIICIVVEIRLGLISRRLLCLKKSLVVNNISIGFPLLMGNIIVNLLTAVDRWFVKFGGNNAEFAFYSFAVNIEQLLIVLFKPFQITLYSFLCRNKEDKQIISDIREYIFIGGAILCSSVFPIKWLIELYIDKYVQAITVLIILFATIIPSAVINSVYVNLYKAYGLQNKFFKRNLFIVVVAIIMDTIVFFWNPSLANYAIATLITNVIWYFLALIDFKQYAIKLFEVLKNILCIFAFVVIGTMFGGLMGFGIYISIICVLYYKTIIKMVKLATKQ